MPPLRPLPSGFICQLCRHSLRQIARTRPLSSTARRVASPTKSGSKEIDDYYALLLDNPLPSGAATQRQRPSSPPPAATPPRNTPAESPPSDVEARARVVFGTRLAGPVERAKRREERDAAASVVAGVRIPPRPGEPDNCCMSGCVNCVWDLYREELEEWAAKRQEAEMRMHGGDAAEKGRQSVTGGGMAEGATTMDDDGGGSETNWDSLDARLPKGKGLFDTVPVGIREFMRTEKRLGKRREQRAKEAETE